MYTRSLPYRTGAENEKIGKLEKATQFFNLNFEILSDERIRIYYTVYSAIRIILLIFID